MGPIRSGGALLVAGLVGGACSYDWEQFDPRLGVTPAGGATGTPTASGGGGVGGQAGNGGQGADGGSAGSGGALGGAGGGVLGPFGTPEVVAELSDPEDDDDPTFTADLRELYFNSGRSPSGIWTSSRAQPTDPWGTPVSVPELNSSDGETNPVIAPDGLTIWLATNRGSSGIHFDIYVSTRPDRGTAWSTPVAVPELNSSVHDIPGTVSSDGLTFLLYQDDPAGSTGDDLYVATRPTTSSPWGAPAAITALNTNVGDSQPWLSPDELTLYYDSQRDGGDQDIYISTRAASTDAWGVPTAVTELNTAGDDADAWLSPDMRYIMLTRGTVGAREIYHAFR